MVENLRILIVDDSSVIRRSIERYLRNQGIEAEFYAAGDGETAIDQVEEHQPHIMTLDITMPEMDGLECLEEVLKRDEDLKVLIISALADTDTAVEALSRGAMDFVTKPFTPEELAEYIQRLIALVDSDSESVN
jgi:two-component system chemotaxis response regulator CheY